MVAAEFWEQGDLERTVLEQEPIVSNWNVFCDVILSTGIKYIKTSKLSQDSLFRIDCSAADTFLLGNLSSAHDGQEEGR